jgi:hypothetical protein
LSDLNKKDRNKRHSSPFINVVKGVFFVVRITLVPVSYLSAPSAVHSYRVPGKFIRRLKSLFVGWKVYSSSTNKAKIYSYSIFVQQMYWLQDKRWYWNKFTAMSYATHNKWNKITCGKFDIWYIQYWRPEIAVCKYTHDGI